MDQLSEHIFELRAKVEEKTKQIKDLQTSLGLVLANYFNLKNVLYDDFGEKVKSLFQQPHGVVDPPSIQSPLATDDLPVEKEPEESRARITIKTGIRMWAFDPVTKLWVVKRKSGASECYKSTHDFNSWTKTDLAELSRAPFHNPSEDPNASNFKRFLDR
ncbi:unnamed protein product [Lactuca saligna]|uniref:Uncharacterized protein n=1 Tax=Lactuca saligna TaxID=75948 RepID=A0AA36EL93_LACSI|nr:unnamed protein product [Lactuca saligna]